MKQAVRNDSLFFCSKINVLHNASRSIFGEKYSTKRMKGFNALIIFSIILRFKSTIAEVFSHA